MLCLSLIGMTERHFERDDEVLGAFVVANLAPSREDRRSTSFDSAIRLANFDKDFSVEEVGQDWQQEEPDTKLTQVLSIHDRSLREQVLDLTHRFGSFFNEFFRSEQRHHLVSVILFVLLDIELDIGHVALVVDEAVEEGVDCDHAVFLAVLQDKLSQGLNRKLHHVDIALSHVRDTVVVDVLYLRVVFGQAGALLDRMHDVLVELEATFDLACLA